MDITFVYYTYSKKSGTERYSLHLLKALVSIAQDMGVKIYPIQLRKIEIPLLGLPFGGNTSLFIQSALTFPPTRVVHSTSPEVITPRTNIVTVHDVFPLKYRHMYSRTLLRRLSNERVFKRIQRIDRIISVSYSTAKDLENLMDIEKDRIRVVYEGVDFRTFYRDEDMPRGLDRGKTSLLLVGDLNPRKKYEIVFKAITQLDDVVAYHIGPRNNWEARWKAIEKIAKSYPDRIRLLGPRSDDELRRWLSNVDFFVFPSMDEGFGLPALEAMACGTNVILSDIPVFREIAGDYAAAYFDLSVEGFIKAFERALKNRKKPEELIKYARQFTWEKTAKETIKVYKELL